MLVSCLSTTEIIFLKAACASRTSDICQPRTVHPWYTTFRVTRFWVIAARVLNSKMHFVSMWNDGEVQKTSSYKLRTLLLMSTTSTVIIVSIPAPLSVFTRMSKIKSTSSYWFRCKIIPWISLSVCNSEQSTGSILVKPHRIKPH